MSSRNPIGNSYEPTGPSTIVKQRHLTPRDLDLLRCTLPEPTDLVGSQVGPQRPPDGPGKDQRLRDHHGPPVTDMGVSIYVFDLYNPVSGVQRQRRPGFGSQAPPFGPASTPATVESRTCQAAAMPIVSAPALGGPRKTLALLPGIWHIDETTSSRTTAAMLRLCGPLVPRGYPCNNRHDSPCCLPAY